MKRVKIVEGQTHTFDALAKILHTQREQIVDLVSREKHPLPLPVLVEDLDEQSLLYDYRDVLYKWVIDEKKMAETADTCQLDLDQIQHELAEETGDKPEKNRWSIEQSLESYPPGHFLG